MKNKGLSVLLSFVLVLMLAVSFSVPVFANGSTSISDSGSIVMDEVVTEEVSYEGSLTSQTFNRGRMFYVKIINLCSGLIEDEYYKVNLTISGDFIFNDNCGMRGFGLSIGDIPVLYYANMNNDTTFKTDHSFTNTVDVILPGSLLLDSRCSINSEILASSSKNVSSYTSNLQFTVNSVEALTADDADQYESGYNAGYSAGEESGYSSGYSSGFDDGFNSVDQDAIYDQGYQAGADSVDTQSYYDAGYDAGYSVGQLEGYELGYESGYNDAMERFASWGADTSEYPKLISEDSKLDVILGVTVKGSTPVQYSSFYSWTNSADFNPSHTYCFYVDLSPLSYTGSKIYFLEEDIYFLNVGGIKFKLSDFDNADVNKFFIPGDRISSAYSFSWEPYCAIYGDTLESSNGYVHFNLDYSIYDYGPAGDTQNHIANQTDQLTNGYDSSSITSSNTALSGSIAEFTGAESQITDQSFGFIDQVQFYDLNTQPQMLACITFCSSWLQSLFVNIGDWGILVMVSLSLGFGLMLIGWFKYRRK